MLFGLRSPAEKAAAVSLPEMFLPALLAAKTGTPLLKFVIAAVSIVITIPIAMLLGFADVIPG